MNNQNILLAIICVLIIVYFIMNEKTAKTEVLKVNNNSTDGQIFNRFFNTLIDIHSQYNLSVPIPLCLAVIQQESGLLFKTKSNDKVLGDGTNSVGYMQVSKSAVNDVNKSKQMFFTFSDVYNEKKNLTIGCLYLDLCYLSALSDSPSDPLRIALKKYNGGRDETLKSKNTMAENYSNSAIKFYNKFAEYAT